MIEKQTLEYYYFDDIEAFICKELGISADDFRDYQKHDTEGSDYKDWWHVWMTLVYGDVENYGYKTVFFDIMLGRLEDQGVIEEYGDWILKLKPVLEKLQEELGDDIVVNYSW